MQINNIIQFINKLNILRFFFVKTFKNTSFESLIEEPPIVTAANDDKEAQAKIAGKASK